MRVLGRENPCWKRKITGMDVRYSFWIYIMVAFYSATPLHGVVLEYKAQNNLNYSVERVYMFEDGNNAKNNKKVHNICLLEYGDYKNTSKSNDVSVKVYQALLEGNAPSIHNYGLYKPSPVDLPRGLYNKRILYSGSTTFSTPFPIMPEYPVAVNDTWDCDYSLSFSYTSVPITVHHELKSIKTLDNADVAEIVYSYKREFDTREYNGNIWGDDITYRPVRSSEESGTVLFNIEKGIIVKKTAEAKWSMQGMQPPSGPDRLIWDGILPNRKWSCRLEMTLIDSQQAEELKQRAQQREITVQENKEKEKRQNEAIANMEKYRYDVFLKTGPAKFNQEEENRVSKEAYELIFPGIPGAPLRAVSKLDGSAKEDPPMGNDGDGRMTWRSKEELIDQYKWEIYPELLFEDYEFLPVKPGGELTLGKTWTSEFKTVPSAMLAVVANTLEMCTVSVAHEVTRVFEFNGCRYVEVKYDISSSCGLVGDIENHQTQVRSYGSGQALIDMTNDIIVRKTTKGTICLEHDSIERSPTWSKRQSIPFYSSYELISIDEKTVDLPRKINVWKWIVFALAFLALSIMAVLFYMKYSKRRLSFSKIIGIY